MAWGVAIAALLFAVLPSRADAQPVTVAIGSRVDTVAPHSATTFAEIVIAETLHRGLVHYEPDGRIAPGLAESWSISGNGLIYTFTLKPNLTWSDGRSLGAADIVAGIEYALDPDRPAPFAAKLFPIENAEAYLTGTLEDGDSLGVASPDSQTVVFRLERRAFNFLDVLAHPAAMPVPAADPEAASDGRVTSGPVRVEQWRDDGALVLAPVTDGPGLIVLPIESVADAWSHALETQAFVSAALPIVTVPRVGDRADMVRIDRGNALYAYAVNTARKPFDSINVRHALAMAVRRAPLLRDLSIDGAVTADHYVQPSLLGKLESYKAPFEPLTFEVREAIAAALLSEQGFDFETPLKVVLRIPQGDIHRTVADQVAAMWATAGIETEIVEAPFPAHWQSLAAGDFDVAFMTWPGRRDTPLGSLEPLSRAGGPWNFPRYDFADFTERLNRANTYDREEMRLGFYREAERALIEDQTLIALFFYRPLVLVSPGVTGWQANTAGRHPLPALSPRKAEGRLNLIRPPLPQAVPSFGEDP